MCHFYTYPILFHLVPPLPHTILTIFQPTNLIYLVEQSEVWTINNVIWVFIICLSLGHRFYYGNSYTKICAILMPICTENGFCFLHCDWLDIIPLSYPFIKIQFLDPQPGHQTNIHNVIFNTLSIYVGLQM